MQRVHRERGAEAVARRTAGLGRAISLGRDLLTLLRRSRSRSVAAAPGMTSASENASVTAVIPCFRCEATLTRAVQSVLNQTRRPRELILVDDGNDAATAAVLRELELKHKEWIRLLRLPKNVGPSGARNAGWNAARGKYVAFLDADDTWVAEKLRARS